MKKVFLIAFAAFFVLSCSQNIDDRAAQEAREFTEKYCPGPFVNDTRTDSAAYDRGTRTYTYYYTFAGELDNKAFVEANRTTLDEGLRSIIINSPEMQPFVEAGITFQYIAHSLAEPEKVVYTTKIKF